MQQNTNSNLSGKTCKDSPTKVQLSPNRDYASNPLDPQWLYEFHKDQNASKMPRNPTMIVPNIIYSGNTDYLKLKSSSRLRNLLSLQK